MAFFKNRKDNRIHKFSCTSCNATVFVNFSYVRKGYTAVCKSCGAEYPFSESDERLVRKLKKLIS